VVAALREIVSFDKHEMPPVESPHHFCVATTSLNPKKSHCKKRTALLIAAKITPTYRPLPYQ
jgi:hypothetical protein